MKFWLSCSQAWNWKLDDISRRFALFISAAAKRAFGSPVHFLWAALFRCLTICQSPG